MVTGTFTNDKDVLVIENNSYMVVISSLELKVDSSEYKKVTTKGTYSHRDLSQLLNYIAGLEEGLTKPILKSVTLMLNHNSLQR
jgi:hypothetical protein